MGVRIARIFKLAMDFWICLEEFSFLKRGFAKVFSRVAAAWARTGGRRVDGFCRPFFHALLEMVEPMVAAAFVFKALAVVSAQGPVAFLDGTHVFFSLGRRADGFHPWIPTAYRMKKGMRE